MNDPLFRPVVIRILTIKNRIAMLPMHLNMCEQYRVTSKLRAFYRPRAAGGAGLISGFRAGDGFQ